MTKLAENADRDRLLYFLNSVWQTEKLKGFEQFWLRNDGEWSVKVQDLELIPNDVFRPTNHAFYYSPHIFLRKKGKLKGRKKELICQLNSIILDFDGNLSLTEITKSLSELGLKPHYIIETSPDHYQTIFKLKPIRLGKKNRTPKLKKLGWVIQRLSELTESDQDAAKVNQLFRLPYSQRPDINFKVKVLEKSDHKKYRLDSVSKKLTGKSKPKSTYRGYKVKGKKTERIFRAPPIRKLLNTTVLTGSRNTALVALCYSYAMAGYSYEKAKPELLKWVQEHTEGPYPYHKSTKSQDSPEAVIRSCFENPKGLDWKKLAIIETSEGQIGQTCAKKVNKYMPRSKQIHERKPFSELKNRPLIESLLKVLKTIFKLQKENGGRPVLITNQELAIRSEVPFGTLISRINPGLREKGIKDVVRIGRTQTSRYQLRSISDYSPYAFIRSSLFKRPLHSVISYWLFRFKELWTQLNMLLSQIRSWLWGLYSGRWSERDQKAVAGLLPKPHSRDPPRWQDGSFFSLERGGDLNEL